MCSEKDGAAPNAVEVGDLYHGVVVVDGIVGFARATVRTDIEIGIAASFPVATIGRKISGLDPVALFET